jgi:Tol biopolymer transport system component
MTDDLLDRLRITTLVVLSTCIALSGCSGDEPIDGPNDSVDTPTGTLYVTSGAGDIVVLDLAARQATTLRAGRDAHPSVNGTLVYVTPGSGLVERSLDGTQAATVVVENRQNASRFDDSFANPQVSPNGRYIAYQSLMENPSGVFVVERDNGELAAEFGSAAAQTGYDRPTWTPDGRLVFAGAGPDSPGLYITDAALRFPTRFDSGLNEPRQPDVSPDGTSVALVVAGRLWTMGIDGSGARAVAIPDSTIELPSWSTDGKWIAYHTGATIKFTKPGSGTSIDLRELGSAFAASRLSIANGAQIEWR